MKLNIKRQWKNNGFNEKISQHETTFLGTRFSATMTHNKEHPDIIKVELSGGQYREHSNMVLPIVDFIINIPQEHFGKYYSNPKSLLKLEPETAKELGIKVSNMTSHVINPRFDGEIENMHSVYPISAPKAQPANSNTQTASISTHRDDNLFSTGHYIG